jgi:hypothetical protein
MGYKDFQNIAILSKIVGTKIATSKPKLQFLQDVLVFRQTHGPEKGIREQHGFNQAIPANSWNKNRLGRFTVYAMPYANLSFS